VRSDLALSREMSALPYRRSEATFSVSATKFYEHLAACRPILSTRGMDELLQKEPLLKLVDNGCDVVAELERLRDFDFRDNYEEARGRARAEGTSEARASAMVSWADQGHPACERECQPGLTIAATGVAQA
jgi:hypothetical protein